MPESESGQCRRSVGRIQDVLALLATANLGCSDVWYVAEPGPAHLPAAFVSLYESVSLVPDLLIALANLLDGVKAPRCRSKINYPEWKKNKWIYINVERGIDLEAPTLSPDRRQRLPTSSPSEPTT